MTNKELVNYFLMYQETKNLSSRSIEWYQRTLDKFLEYTNEKKISIVNMTIPQARGYVNWLQNAKTKTKTGRNYKGNGINGFIRSVKVMFNYLIEDEYIEKNPFAKVKQIKCDKVIVETFTNEEIKKMLNQFNKSIYTDYRDFLFMKILYDCGLRISEVTNLKIKDIDFDNGLFKIFGKGSKERFVPFGRSVKREILRFLPKREKEVPSNLDEGYLLSTRLGTALTRRNVDKKIKTIGNKAKIEDKRISAHVFRHSFSKQFLMAGGDLVSLQNILGHAEISTTRQYLNLNIKDIQIQHKKFSPLDNL